MLISHGEQYSSVVCWLGMSTYADSVSLSWMTIDRGSKEGSMQSDCLLDLNNLYHNTVHQRETICEVVDFILAAFVLAQ